MTDSPWPVIHAERAALADDLAVVAPDRWSTPSLCTGWSVHEVLGHMTATAMMTPLGFVGQLARAGFRFGTMTRRNIDAETAGGPARTLARFRQAQTHSSGPPGPVDSWLGETLVHAEDIRRPLGLPRTIDPERLRLVLDRPDPFARPRRFTRGLRFAATDLPWEHGSGPEVRGQSEALVLAMVGMASVLDELEGDGVGLLRARMLPGHESTSGR